MNESSMSWWGRCLLAVLGVLSSLAFAGTALETKRGWQARVSFEFRDISVPAFFEIVSEISEHEVVVDSCAEQLKLSVRLANVPL